MPNVNWAEVALTALSLIPSQIVNVEKIVTDAKSGVAKKQLVQESIATATGIATLSGADKEKADAISALVSANIDAAVQIKNLFGHFKKS